MRALKQRSGVAVSSYEVQKMIRDINRDPKLRQDFFADADAVAQRYDLTEDEKTNIRTRDYGALYALGVHGLLLRPFSLLHGVSEKDYLEAIRKERVS